MTNQEQEGYCMKCRQARKMKNVQIVTTDKGRRMAKGICTVCGTKMTRFLSSKSG
jgi:hypothetical protein